jgi:hypothetical protein
MRRDLEVECVKMGYFMIDSAMPRIRNTVSTGELALNMLQKASLLGLIIALML